MDSIPFVPRYTWEERIKYSFPRLYLRYLLRKHWRKGEPELKMLPAFVPPGRAAIDVGANKGVYTYHLSRLCPHVYAFEPNPKMYRVLCRTLPKNVTAYTCALSDSAGSAELIVPIHGGFFSNATGSLNPLKKEHRHGTMSVETRTIDSFKFTNIGFIKIDVEGFEKTVLLGARETLMRERPVVQVEMEEVHTGEPIEVSHAFMKQFDMDGFFVRDGRLLALASFDADRDHRQRVRKPGYVNNFIFKPRELARG
ncbi:MAG: FkbM family methyltransferase [Rhodospirillaceae bacterium]